MDNTTNDQFLGGKLTLRQPRKGHRAGTDSVLLAMFVEARAGQVIADLGAGVGTVGLVAATNNKGSSLILIEREAELAALAAQNLITNHIQGHAYALDVAAPHQARLEAGLKPKSAHHIVANPPFNPKAHYQSSPDSLRSKAHDLGEEGLESWLHMAAWLSAPKATLTLLLRPENLSEAIGSLKGRFGSPKITPIHPYAHEPADRIILQAIQGGRAALKLMPPLIMHEAGGALTSQARDKLQAL